MELSELPGYIVKCELGKGAMAIVYLAIQTKFERKVALKVMSPHLVPNPVFGAQFQREALLVARLNHQHIVPIYDVGQQGNYHYLAMEYLPGGDLSQKLQASMSLGESIYIVRCVARALDYAAGQHYVHRDIKPENILFRDDGCPVLSDFGIARSSDSETQSHLTRMDMVAGTPNYMSPEQWLGNAVDGRSDLYSLGVIFFKMLSGRVPYRGDTAVSVARQHVDSNVPPLPPSTAQFQGFINIALAKDPDDRFQTGLKFIEALDQIEQHQSAEMGSTVILQDPQTHLSSAANFSEKTVIWSAGLPQQTTPDSNPPHPSRTELSGLPGGGSRRKRRALTASLMACLMAGGGALVLWAYFTWRPTAPTSEPVISQSELKQKPVLAKATQAMANERYFLPKQDRTEDYLVTLLSQRLDSGNAQAQQSIESIVSDLSMASNATDRKDFSLANEHLAQEALAGKLSALYIITRRQIEGAQFAAAKKTLDELTRTGATAAAAARTTDSGSASAVATAAPTAHKAEVTAAGVDAEENQLLQSTRTLSDQQRTVTVNNELRHIYQQILAINPNNSLASRGLEGTSEFEMARARRAIQQHKFDSARQNIALIGSATPNYSGLRALNVELEEAEAAHARVSEELVRAEAQIVVPYRYSRSRSKHKASRQRLLAAHAHIEEARQLDVGHPGLKPAMARLEQEYANIISQLLAKNKLNFAEDFLSDSLGKPWASQHIAEMQARYEEQKVTKGGDISSFGNVGF
jgi:serine/threonine protein kinase